MVKISQKQLQIDKASQRVIVITSVAVFVVMFCAVASYALFNQLMYQNRIVNAKKQALSQLEKNKEAVANLETSYKGFVSTGQNAIGGSSIGTGPQDGDNAKIVLDALPSKYDFPALATSLEKLLTAQKLEIQSITGTDDELAQSSNTGTGKPEPVPVPFELTANGNYQSVQNLTNTFKSSIRPIELQTMTLSGENNDLTVTVTAQTYYQPAKTFTIGKKVIK